MKTKLFLFLLALMVSSSQLSAQTANEEHSSYYTAGKEYYDNEDYANAFEQFKQGSELGFADAQAVLGYCYATGKGVAKDLEKAFSWFKKSAEQENALGQYYLSLCYLNGAGVDKDIIQGLKWLEKAAKQGDANAQIELGECYYEGIGVPTDYKSAFYWFKQAAIQGDEMGQYNVGFCYLYGKGIEKDEQLAVNWLKQAAEQGHDAAQYLLGLCYREGYGVPEDLKEAKSWFEKAAAQGYEKAKTALAELKKPTASQSAAKDSQPAASDSANDDGSPKATKAEVAALKKFMAGMVGHTYQCSKYSIGEPYDYIMSSGGMQLIVTVKFISKTQAKIESTLKLNSSAARQSPTAYNIKEAVDRTMNYTGTIYTWGPYLAIKNPRGSDFKFKPREGTLKLETQSGNIFKKIK